MSDSTASSGRNFFSGTDATNMAVDAQLTAAGGTDKIAAGRMVADPNATSGFSVAAGDSSNAVALAQLQDLIAQRSTSTPGGLAPGQTLGAAKLIGLDLSGAAANTTYTFSVAAGPPLAVSVSDGTTTTAGQIDGRRRRRSAAQPDHQRRHRPRPTDAVRRDLAPR